MPKMNNAVLAAELTARLKLDVPVTKRAVSKARMGRGRHGSLKALVANLTPGEK